MIAELYILSESFAYNANFTNAVIEEKIKSLANDFVIIKKYKDTNKLFVHPDIYNVQFLQGITLSDLLFNPIAAKKNIDRDVYNALKTIVIESATTTNTTQEVIEVLLPEHNEDICHGLIAFHKVGGIDEMVQLIYGIDGWFTFRRHFLSLYPKNSDFFIDECVKYFQTLFFHDRNKMTVGAILHNCSHKIIYHLAALNDKFRACQIQGLNRTQVLNQFSIIAHLDANASLEGNAARKPDLTFQFINNEHQIEDVCCEPHLKLCYNDNYPGDNSYSNDRRIYFHEGIASIQKGKILVGHIGDHL